MRVVCECAFCTFPDKPTAAGELARVLRPGGRVGITDVTIDPGRLPEELTSLQAWVACIADARPLDGYADLLRAAGLRARYTQRQDDAMRRMLDQIEARLALVRITARERAEALGSDLADAPRVLAVAREALAREGIEVRLGRASFVEPGRVEVNGHSIAAPRCVIATGSRPAVPPIPGLETVPYLTNETVFDLPAQPKSLAVLGGGAIGCELAQAFARLGATVTLVEAADRLLPDEEPEASQVIEAVFGREHIDVRTGTRLEKAALRSDGLMQLTLSDSYSMVVEQLLVATGRVPVTDGLAVDAAGVRLDDSGCVVTDDRLATTVRGVFAAGDVTGRLAFTHAAYEMGRIAAHNALSRTKRRYRPDAIPRVTFTDPEVAHVGLNEPQAALRNGRVAYLPMCEMDRALTAGETDGYIKLMAGPRRPLGNTGGGRILGAAIVATRAGELIHEPALAVATGMFTGRLAATTHAYPNLILRSSTRRSPVLPAPRWPPGSAGNRVR